MKERDWYKVAGEEAEEEAEEEVKEAGVDRRGGDRDRPDDGGEGGKNTMIRAA